MTVNHARPSGPECSDSLSKVKVTLQPTVSLSVEIEVNLRPTVSRPVCLGAGIPSGSHDQISFISLTITGFLIWAPSLMRGWVCNLLVQLLLGRAVTLGSKSCRTQRSYFTVSFPTPPPPPTWRARSPYLYSQEQSGPVIPPATEFPICRLLRLAVLLRSYPNPPQHGALCQSGLLTRI
jgi:hypothetical protein